MSDVTSLVIPKHLIQDAKSLDLNCSEIARNAIEKEVNQKRGIPQNTQQGS